MWNVKNHGNGKTRNGNVKKLYFNLIKKLNISEDSISKKRKYIY